MSDVARISALDGIRSYLRRTKSKTELEALADALITTDPEDLETVITTLGFGASTANAVMRAGIDRFQVLQQVEGLIREMVQAGVAAWTEAQSAAEVRGVVHRVGFDGACAGN